MVPVKAHNDFETFGQERSSVIEQEPYLQGQNPFLLRYEHTRPVGSAIAEKTQIRSLHPTSCSIHKCYTQSTK